MPNRRGAENRSHAMHGAVRELHTLGRDSQTISEAIGVCRATVKLYLKQMGLTPITPTPKDRRKKSSTAFKVRQLRIDNPYMSMVEIANTTRVSHQRVKQILDFAGLRASRVDTARPMCSACGMARPKSRKAYPSGLCGSCKSERRMVELTCASCGNTFKRKDYELESQVALRKRRGLPQQTRWFCTRRCMGSLIGKQYGSVGLAKSTAKQNWLRGHV